MLLDILIFIPVLTCIIFGFRDGIVRKVVAIIVLLAALVLAQMNMNDFGSYLMTHGGVTQENAPVDAFLIIFLGSMIVQAILYRLIAKNYKKGGLVDRIGGIVLGFIEGVLFVSALLFIFALLDFPDRNNKHDSQFYKSVVNIAPQILDMTSTLAPDVLQKLNDVGTPESLDSAKKAIPRSNEPLRETKK